MQDVLAKHVADLDCVGVIAFSDFNNKQNVWSSGVRMAGGSDPMLQSDLLHLGSCTKAMTGIMIDRLVDTGVFVQGWNTTVQQVFDSINCPHPPALQITLWHLVNHVAGLPANLDNWWKFDQKYFDIRQRRAAVVRDAFERWDINALNRVAIGSYLYSNVGYVVASAMVEHVTGKSWESLMRELLFVPLGMNSAGFGEPTQPYTHWGDGNTRNDRNKDGSSERDANTSKTSVNQSIFSSVLSSLTSALHVGTTISSTSQPWGHRLQPSSTVFNNNSKWAPQQRDNAQVMAPAGGVHCSAEDLLTFLRLFYLSPSPNDISEPSFNDGYKINLARLYTFLWASSPSQCPEGKTEGGEGTSLPILSPPSNAVSSVVGGNITRYRMGWNILQRPWAASSSFSAENDVTSDASSSHSHPSQSPPSSSSSTYPHDSLLPFPPRDLVLQHTGCNTQWFCSIWLAPQRRACYVVVTNSYDPQHTPHVVDTIVSKMILQGAQ